MGEIIEHTDNCCAACATKISETHEAIAKITAAISSIDLSNLNPMDLVKMLLSKK